MRVLLILVIVMFLSFSLVSAEISLPCNEDRDCVLFTGIELSCVNGYCDTQTAVHESIKLLGDPDFANDDWNFAYIDYTVKENECNEEGCIKFAPVYKDFLAEFFDFLFNVRYSL